MAKRKLKEYRVNHKNSSQGHYILAYSKAGALKEMCKHPYFARDPKEDFDIHLWKIMEAGHHYPNKLTPYARRKMGMGRKS